MPSPSHDDLIQMIRERPQLAADILRELMGVDLPVTPQICVEDIRPSGDFEADLVVVVGPPQNPAHAIIVEIRQDTSKAPDQLARCAAALWLRLGCDVTILAICPDREAAAYYAQPIDSGLTGYRLQPHVLGPNYFLISTYPHQASTDPAFSAMAKMMAMVRRMAPSTWPVYSPFAREHYGRGVEVGRAMKKAEGRLEGAAQVVLIALGARGFEVPDDARARITACTDLAQLETWVTRTVTAESLDDLFK